MRKRPLLLSKARPIFDYLGSAKMNAALFFLLCSGPLDAQQHTLPPGTPDSYTEHAFENFTESFSDLFTLDKRHTYFYDQNNRVVARLKYEGKEVYPEHTNEATHCLANDQDSMCIDLPELASFVLFDTIAYKVHVDDRKKQTYIFEQTQEKERTHVNVLRYTGRLDTGVGKNIPQAKQKIIDLIREEVSSRDSSVRHIPGAFPYPKSYYDYISGLPSSLAKKILDEPGDITPLDIVFYYTDEGVTLPGGDMTTRGAMILDFIDDIELPHEAMRMPILGQKVQESKCNPEAVSPAGARNYFQRMPPYTKGIQNKYGHVLGTQFSDKEQTIHNEHWHLAGAKMDIEDRLSYLHNGTLSPGTSFDSTYTQSYPRDPHADNAVAIIERHTGEKIPLVDVWYNRKKMKGYTRKLPLEMEAGYYLINEYLDFFSISEKEKWKFVLDVYLTGHVSGQLRPITIYEHVLRRAKTDPAFFRAFTEELSSCHTGTCIDPHEIYTKAYAYYRYSNIDKNFRKRSEQYNRVSVSLGKEMYKALEKRYR